MSLGDEEKGGGGVSELLFGGCSGGWRFDIN